MLRSTLVPGVLLAALLVACGDAAGVTDPAPVAVTDRAAPGTPDDGAADLPRPTRPPRRSPPESIVPVEPEPVPEPGVPSRAVPIVERAIADLSARLGVAPDEVVVVSAEEVTWRDGAAGCPQPGMAYIQVLTNGSRIRLSVDGTLYHYHTRGSGDPFLCAHPEEPLPADSGYGDA